MTGFIIVIIGAFAGYGAYCAAYHFLDWLYRAWTGGGVNRM